jgi:hypothetical protein
MCAYCTASASAISGQLLASLQQEIIVEVTKTNRLLHYQANCTAAGCAAAAPPNLVLHCSLITTCCQTEGSRKVAANTT